MRMGAAEMETGMSGEKRTRRAVSLNLEMEEGEEMVKVSNWGD